MSAVSVLYTGNQGLYGRVQPITALPEIRVFRREGWEAVPRSNYHITICHDATAQVSPDALTAFLASERVDETTVFDGFPLAALQSWTNNGKLYVGAELYSVHLFNFREKLHATLGVKTDFPIYKCHITYGVFRGLDSSIVDEYAARQSFVDANIEVLSKFPAKIQSSYIGFEDVQS